MFDIGYCIGYLGIAFGLLVAPPQLYKLWKSKSGKDISFHTYLFLCCALVCYLLHAIYIQSIVFIIAQSVNLLTNSIILVVLAKERNGSKRLFNKGFVIKQKGRNV